MLFMITLLNSCLALGESNSEFDNSDVKNSLYVDLKNDCSFCEFRVFEALIYILYNWKTLIV